MKTVALAIVALALVQFTAVSAAYAGDGATIIFKSGTVIYVNNGYQQISTAVREFNKKGGDNYNMEINIEDATFFINLGAVGIVCRDRCKSMEIVSRKDDKEK